MSWFDKFKVKTGLGKKIGKPEEIWIECKKCKDQIYITELDENLRVCPKCDYHFRIDARTRIHQLLNTGTFVEQDQELVATDPLKFKDSKKYKERLKIALKKGQTSDAVVTGPGVLESHAVEVCFFDFTFMGGSMGTVVGEKITRAIERAIENRTPVIIISSSGGARMQEGILSLMQMAKTAAALSKLAKEGLPYISVLTDPTTGGVSASFAMLGDIILAEPGALIGFAGPRVIEQTIRQKLPDGFQRSEFLLKHGLIDQIVHRKDLKKTLHQLLCLLKNEPVSQPANEAT
ncbi:MAG: acetyl-CoA carboxylase carboxyltransferase subunit beta [Nitrospinae bacterium]|nr:acetyl-CoA carboxylase carboxyltransferase subunit beta [Nitrospinota bacterium]